MTGHSSPAYQRGREEACPRIGLYGRVSPSAITAVCHHRPLRATNGQTRPMFSLHDLERTADLVHAHLGPTPALPWPLFAQRTGAEVFVKHENHLPTGAFKVRGGIAY